MDEVLAKALYTGGTHPEEDSWEYIESQEEYCKHSTTFITRIYKKKGFEVYFALVGLNDYNWGEEFEGYYEVAPKEKTVTVWEAIF